MRWRRRDHLLALLAPLLLVAVATLQLWRAHQHDQSSWSGAGFGMFATYEYEQTRFFRIHVGAPGGTTRIAVPPEAQGPALRARVVPTRANLVELGDRLRASRAVASDQTLRIELWAIDHDARRARIDAFVLRSVTLRP